MSNQLHEETSRPNAGHKFGRRALLKMTGASVAAIGVASIITTSTAKAQTMTDEWDKVFPKSDRVDHEKVIVLVVQLSYLDLFHSCSF